MGQRFSTLRCEREEASNSDRPLDEQRRIVAEIEKQFSRLDEAVANLKRVSVNLKRYKTAVLRAAVTGELVDTRAATAGKSMAAQELGAELLARVSTVRAARNGLGAALIQSRSRLAQPISPYCRRVGYGQLRISYQTSSPREQRRQPICSWRAGAKFSFSKVYDLTFDGTLNRGYKPASCEPADA
ncbi:MAG: hypothetical protein U5L03_09935 [Burkholderiaceae bacterium]|nr:hypothetical protein [Burkholderiaceae bacterium]